MLDKQPIKNETFAKFLMVFIMIQPLLDLLTSFSLLSLNLSITPGIIIRFFIMLVSSFYILFSAREKKNRKYLYYLIALAIFFIIHLGINIAIKEPFDLMEELKSIGKIIYPIEMIIAFILAFKDLREKNKKDSFFPVNINVAVWIINIVMVIATLTATGIRSYNGLYKNGHSGWFFAANELGTLLAVAFPIVLWIAIMRTTSIKRVYYWIPVILTSFSLFSIGTKVGFLAVIIGLGMSILGIIVEWGIKFREKRTKRYLLNLSISVLLFGGTLMLMPHLPAFTNTTAHLQAIEDQSNEKNPPTEENDTEEISNEDNLFGESGEEKESVFDGVVYSGRDGFLEMHQQFQENAPLVQKIFGMGYAGNYEESPKIIERDFHDIYFQFGWLGFAMIHLIFAYYIIRIIIIVFKKIIYVLSIKHILLATSLALGIGISYLAGHMITAPAVSTYFAVIFGYLLVDLKVE